MEINRMTVPAQTIEQYMEPAALSSVGVDLMLPEHMVRFKQQMEESRGSAAAWKITRSCFRIFTCWLLRRAKRRLP
jgi:hypothetical protein